MDVSLQEKALSLWQKGDVVAFPTETVYGLGADARKGEAVARIYALKSRPQFNPLIIHVASVEIAKRYGQWNAWADALSRFWPGPLTVVLKRQGGISDLATAGGDTVGIRIPNHPTALALLAAFDGPIAAPSANRSGRISPTTAEHVAQEYPENPPLIIDGGPCVVGLESTVIDLSTTTPTLLRPGAITRTMLEDALGVTFAQGDVAGVLKSPGQLASHYAPTKPLRLNATDYTATEGVLAFGPHMMEAAVSQQLSLTMDMAEAAANMFAALRLLDAHPQVQSIAAMPIPNAGIGEAINDRLMRAAAPKS